MQKLKYLTCILASFYVFGILFFQFHYYPRTTINGINTGWKTSECALDMQKEILKQTKFIISTTEDDENAWLKNETISNKNNLLELQDEIDFDLILSKRYSFFWPFYAWKKYEYSAGRLKVNDANIMEICQNFESKNPKKEIKPQDAKLKYDEKSKQYTVVPERIGNQITLDGTHDMLFTKLQNVTLKQLNQENPIILLLEGCYEQPNIKSNSESFQKEKKKLNKYLKTPMTYESKRGKVVLNADTIHEFLCWDKKFKVSISENAIRDYVINNICSKYNTIGNKRTFVSKGSGKITISGGNYGWIVNVNKEVNKLISDIKTGTIKTRKPIYEQEAKSDKKNDIGNSYIDVSISDQHLWVVKNNKVILSSDVVTGNPSTGHATPKGTFFIEYKTRDYTMRRYNAHVDYWMPIDTSTGVGLHDASWRNSFGSSIYVKNGSHGCINLPTSVAKNIYEICENGYPVIVH